MLKIKLYTRLLAGSFGNIGKNSFICPPFRSFDAKQIYIGNNTRISEYCWLQCIENYSEQEFSPCLKIGSNTGIGRFAHIITCDNIRIGNNVVIAERVYITDNMHGFENINMPVMPQPLKLPGAVIIEDEAWIGDGVCILPNVRIGRHSIIGSNSVVTKDIPEYSVAVGVPAKVIKQFNHKKNIWERVRTETKIKSAKRFAVPAGVL